MNGEGRRSRKRYRYATVRGYRTYVVCGARRRPPVVRMPWISGGVVALVLLVAALTLGRPAPVPGDRPSDFPLLPANRYSASDFFTTVR